MPIKIGGYGPGGCSCTITSVAECPVHGMKRVRYYRYDDKSVSEGSEEYGFSSRVELRALEFDVLSTTPKGVWIDLYGTKRFVKHDSRKKFAHPTTALAKESFIARKKRQLKILTKQIENVRKALRLIEEDGSL